MKAFWDRISRAIWTDGDSTLRPYVWHLHHVGISVLSSVILGAILSLFLSFGYLLSVILIAEVMIIYSKLFYQGRGIKYKTKKDLKDLLTDWNEYQTAWVIYLFHQGHTLLALLCFLVIVSIYYLTIEWSNP